RHELLGSASVAEGSRARQRRVEPRPVPVQGHRRSGDVEGAVHDRARGAQRDASNVHAPAGLSQPGPDPADLPARPRRGLPRSQLDRPRRTPPVAGFCRRRAATPPRISSLALVAKGLVYLCNRLGTIVFVTGLVTVFTGFVTVVTRLETGLVTGLVTG